MIFGKDHVEVVQNIKAAAADRDFHRKVEVGDPNLTNEEREAVVDGYIRQLYSLKYALCNRLVRIITWIMTKCLNRRTKIKGKKHLKGVKGGAVVTSNHFSQIDNTVVRYAICRKFHCHFYIVSQDTNLAMKGIIGFIMRYADIVPLSNSRKNIIDWFGPTIKEMLEDGKKILIYPEQEMWLNYRKPRPPKRGAYYYAAANSVPVISCFVEIKTRHKRETDEFYRTRFIMHILPTIYPDPNKSIRENSIMMMETDYKQKCEAYEKAYGKPLTYDFEPGDIAGWISEESF